MLGRAICVLLSGVCLSVTAVLLAVAFIASWWTPGPLARNPFADDSDLFQSDSDTSNSEITLWGNVGCASNETWADICTLPDQAPVFRTCALIESSIRSAPEWFPVTTTDGPTTTTPIPTLNPNRATTTTAARGDFACANGGTNCNTNNVEEEDPEARWGADATYQGQHQAYGDQTADTPAGGSGTVNSGTSEPGQRVVTTTTQATTPKVQTTVPSVGTKPSTGSAITVPEVSTTRSWLESLADKLSGATTTGAPSGVAVYDPHASPVVSTTEAPPRLPGVEQVVLFCDLGQDEASSALLICQLYSQCGQLDQALKSTFAAAGFASLSAVFLVMFGGVKACGKTRPLFPEYTFGLLAAGAAGGSALSAGIALVCAAGLDVPHTLDGIGAQCAGYSIISSVFAACFLLSAALQAHQYPECPPPPPKTPSVEQLEAEEEFPGLTTPAERTLAVRVAWQPLEDAVKEEVPVQDDVPVQQEVVTAIRPLEFVAAPKQAPTCVVSAPPLPNLSPTRVEKEQTLPRLPLPSTVESEADDGQDPGRTQTPTSPIADNRLSHFFSGDGAVYQQYFYADLQRLEESGRAASTSPSPKHRSNGQRQSHSPARSPSPKHRTDGQRQNMAATWTGGSSSSSPWLREAAAAGRASPRSLEEAGWTTVTSRSLGKTYYLHAATGTTQWNPPALSGSSSARSPALGDRTRRPSGISLSRSLSLDWGNETGLSWTTSSPASPTLRRASTTSLSAQEWADTMLPGSPTWTKKRSKKTGQVYMSKQLSWPASEASTNCSPTARKHPGEDLNNFGSLSVPSVEQEGFLASPSVVVAT